MVEHVIVSEHFLAVGYGQERRAHQRSKAVEAA
jgi:hypothetical protein